MENEPYSSNAFEFEKCRAKNRVDNLVDCLVPEQAHICGYSLSFGSVFFCKHPRQNEIIENTDKLRDKSNLLLDILYSDNQE